LRRTATFPPSVPAAPPRRIRMTRQKRRSKRHRKNTKTTSKRGEISRGARTTRVKRACSVRESNLVRRGTQVSSPRRISIRYRRESGRMRKPRGRIR
jgi:hypothetical protein